MTQEALAEYLGYEQATISRWLAGKQTPHSTVQSEVLKKMEKYQVTEMSGNSPMTSEVVSAYLEKRLNEKFAEVISLGVVPVYVMERLKVKYHQVDERGKQRIEFLMEQLFGDDYPAMSKWVKDVKKEES